VKRIFSSHDRIAVHHARNLLESAGIRTEVRNEFLVSAMGELPPAECDAQVWILDDRDEPSAIEVLRHPAPSGPHWLCAACHEECEDQFTQCWRCGAWR
jgi:hypothetical protein